MLLDGNAATLKRQTYETNEKSSGLTNTTLFGESNCVRTISTSYSNQDSPVGLTDAIEYTVTTKILDCCLHQNHLTDFTFYKLDISMANSA
jgi:hypothetical protein